MIELIINNQEVNVKVARINAGEFGSNCWLVADEATSESVVIDPSPEIDVIKRALDARGVTVKYILLTHGHFDHMTSCDTLRDLTGAPLAVHRADADCLTNAYLNANRIFMDENLTYRPAEILLDDGDTLSFGGLSVKVIHTPGHTKGSCCFMIGDALFTGDTLFDGSVGRCDLPGGDINEMKRSLARIASLDGDFKIYTGHGSNTTLEKQKLYNPYL